MNVAEAKTLVPDGEVHDLPQATASGLLDVASPDPSDPGRFVLAGRPARGSSTTSATGGESEAHRRLKLYVARTPELLHMRPDAVSEFEHLFCTGDRLDLLLENRRPLRAVLEVELRGEQNLIVGVHQATKYRSLAAAERAMTLDTPQARAFVISYEEPTAGVTRLARGYDVGVLSVDRERVLASTA